MMKSERCVSNSINHRKEELRLMKKKDYEALCGRAYTESDIEKVFIVIGKYHNGKIRARTIEILGIDMPTALRMVEKNGIKIYQEKKLSTEKFANNEVMELYLIRTPKQFFIQ